MKDAVLQELEDSLRDAEADRDKIPAQIKAIYDRQAELNQIVKALTFAVEHRRKRLGIANGDDWPNLSRPAAVERVLREAPEPMSPTRIAEVLGDHGRDDPASGVSATLTRLKADGKATTLGYSKWVAVVVSDSVQVSESVEVAITEPESEERPDKIA